MEPLLELIIPVYTVYHGWIKQKDIAKLIMHLEIFIKEQCIRMKNMGMDYSIIINYYMKEIGLMEFSMGSIHWENNQMLLLVRNAYGKIILLWVEHVEGS